MDTSLIAALAPAFAAGFAVQRLLEILDPLAERVAGPEKKKIFLGVSSLVTGLGFAAGLGVRVLAHLGANGSKSEFDKYDLLDLLVTGLVISGGTEGFNSILKFMSYKKEETKATALTETLSARTAESRMNIEGPLTATSEAGMTSNECIDWRMGEFRQRVRRAVAAWAQEPVESILPSATLGELAKGTPWNAGQQARLVQSVNANQVFAPTSPNTRMRPPSQVLPSATTVEEFEKVAWRHQDPITECLAFTD